MPLNRSQPFQEAGDLNTKRKIILEGWLTFWGMEEQNWKLFFYWGFQILFITSLEQKPSKMTPTQTNRNIPTPFNSPIKTLCWFQVYRRAIQLCTCVCSLVFRSSSGQVITELSRVPCAMWPLLLVCLMVTMTLCAGQKKRHRCTEQTFGLWEKARVGWSERTALKHVYYQGWNRSPAQVGCMRQVLRAGALGWPRGMGWGGRWEGASGWGMHVNPWLIHVNLWQKPLQYCKVISLQLIKISEKKA